MTIKDQIWAAEDIQERDVEVPQWGVTLRVRSLTLEQVAEISAHAVKIVKGKAEVDNRLQMAGLLCEGIIEPEFSFDEAQRLLKKSAAAVSQIVAVINELSGLLPEATAEAEKSADGGSVLTLPVRPGARAQKDQTPVAPRDVSS